jgi:predicted Zn finger-like uncharacterized protein
MHLTCPSCETKFLIDPDQIGPAGRRVRCGNCGHDWVQARPTESESEAASSESLESPSEEPGLAAEEAVVEPPRPEPARRRSGPKPVRSTQPEPGGRRVAIGWMLFLVVVIALGAAAYFGRERIVAAVPAAGELYRMAGLDTKPAPGAGLELREVKSVRRMIDGDRVVVIEGVVANLTDQSRSVPELRASLTDSSGKRVDEWKFSAKQASLPPGGVTTFETSTKKAPREGSLAIDFVTD